MEKDNKFETLYDHYKETYSLSKSAQERRNKGFVLLCVLEAISFLMTWNPAWICGLLNDAASKKLESTIQISSNILQTTLWILIAYVLVRYIQDVLYIERQYGYIAHLEKKISELMGDNLFSREGENYTKDYPIVLNLIDLFYKMLCPVLFSVINVYHIIQEWNSSAYGFSLTCDTIICSAIFIITWFYFFEIHSKINAWFLKCKPIAWIDMKLRKLLKEV